ncbi:MAG: glycosyltransferase family 1 protein, partial [Candidatus Omnitrophica bacterium]|nr:glycosyltransferase family 1 protein [Candidatus Omnitrophota bacterium]
MAIIGLDATYLSIYGKGASRHQYNLIKSLSKLDKKNCYYVFLNRKNILPDLPSQENFYYVRICIPKRIIWDQFQLPFIIMKYKLDIYYSLNDTLPFFGRGKFVLFLFEIPDYRIELARHSGNNFLYARLSQGYNRLFFRPSLRKAKVIIASSNSKKNDLIERYNVNEKKIRVIYSAAEECFRAANGDKGLFNTRKKYDAEAGYILHISSLDPRDNTLAVIRAYQKVRSNLKTPKKLIICGSINPEESGLRKLITESNLEKSIIFTGHLSLLSEELVALYQAADLYVDMSLYEGFGFQVVEAMSCGIPVITSGVTSLP